MYRLVHSSCCRSLQGNWKLSSPIAQRFLCASEGSSSNSDSHASSSTSENQDMFSWRGRLLQASLKHIPSHGWTMDSVRAGARDLGLAETASGMLENGPADLVLHFVENCNEQLLDDIQQWRKEQEEAGEHVGTSKIIHEAVQRRLQMLVPHRKSWPEALALCSSPAVAPDALKSLLHLLDDIWHLAGDRSTEFSWYTKRATLASVYCSTELFLLMDTSEDQKETWRFLDDRLRDVAKFGRCQGEVQKTADDVLQSVREIGNAVWKMAGL